MLPFQLLKALLEDSVAHEQAEFMALQDATVLVKHHVLIQQKVVYAVGFKLLKTVTKKVLSKLAGE